MLGVDFSAELLAVAERQRGALASDRLSYRNADLWRRLAEDGCFDVALNVFSSVGYGTEQDDLEVLSTLRAAVRPGGRVFIETAHRDWLVVALCHSQQHAHRLEDGTLIIEEPHFDALTGRVDSSWHWSGPSGAGIKRSSARSYTATELARLMTAAGLRVLSAHDGCTEAPFRSAGPAMSRRLGLLAIREV